MNRWYIFSHVWSTTVGGIILQIRLTPPGFFLVTSCPATITRMRPMSRSSVCTVSPAVHFCNRQTGLVPSPLCQAPAFAFPRQSHTGKTQRKSKTITVIILIACLKLRGIKVVNFYPLWFQGSGPKRHERLLMFCKDILKWPQYNAI